MPTPEFVLSLREKIGHDQVWLPGVSLVVVDDSGRVLLGRRADTGRWSIIDGIPEPGEQPAAAAVRECEEEAGIRPEVLAVTVVEAEEPIVYPNGDRCVFLDTCFVARAGADQAATAGVGDGELTTVAWFAPDALPAPLTRHASARIAAARAWLADPTTPARFRLR
ncbi:NUDIX domain-containing protein [uncultured Actinomyces sp.]|uniref:NUDIX hydrolase n=1 Tax=uncultured Actinomyces sp. TaxID=249061 RepID=UPI00288B9062|nr:NUDIX domain-containing protein [uncultured Actinomyces sp.]